MLNHDLQPLLAPASVALVGASGRAGSLGRVLLENALAGSYQGALYAVNPRRRRVLGRKCYASLDAIDASIDLAVVGAPTAAVPGVLRDAGHAGVKAAVILSTPPADLPAAIRWRREVVDLAHRYGIRLLGPGAFGVVRTDLGLTAAISNVRVWPGRLALVAQSGSVCAAMLDFAAPMRLGFSTVISLGGGLDVGFGEVLDALVVDSSTDAILLYVEAVGEARRFMSALRAAARTKPVVVLKAGRALESVPSHGRLPAHDAVFGAALQRAGTVRVQTYTQLFAAARMLAMGRIPAQDRLAIVANGRGPGLLAADSAGESGVALARFDAATLARLRQFLPAQSACANPVDARADATPARLAEAVAIVLADANVDAVLALHVPRPQIGATDAARAVAGVARASTKPVLAAWLGSGDRQEAHAALDAGGCAHFFTPEDAVEAFSLVAAYRRNQQLLLEVPPPQPAPGTPDLVVAETLRHDARTHRRRSLTLSETYAVLSAFGVVVAPHAAVETLAEAQAAARRLRYPVELVRDDTGVPPASLADPVRDSRRLRRAWGETLGAAPRTREPAAGGVIQRTPLHATRLVAIAVATDPVFGPVIMLGPGLAGPGGGRALMLPPLNRRLALDLIAAAYPVPAATGEDPTWEGVVQMLLQVSTLVCALPWVRSLVLDPIVLAPDATVVVRASARVDPRRRAAAGYPHMAIHPYPVELAGDVTLSDGTPLHVRPIRPEDAEAERRFVEGLSEESRYARFFFHLHALTPQMLARFTQVDYDREMALIAVVPDLAVPSGEAIIAVARYVELPGRTDAEFAVVVADAWQQRGVARALMDRLIVCARGRGLARLTGNVLRENAKMRSFVAQLGFTWRDDPDDAEIGVATLELAPAAGRRR